MSGFFKTPTSKSKRQRQSSWESAFNSKRKPPEAAATTSAPETETTNNGNNGTHVGGSIERPEETDCTWDLWSDDTEEEQDFAEEKDHSSNEKEAEKVEGIEQAISFIACVFVQNNISRHLAMDIFTIGNLLKQHPSLKLSHIKKKLDDWESLDSRVYAFCVVCNSILKSSKKCENRSCSRFGISQANVSSLKTIITFSIRKQIEQLIDNGCFDSTLLNRAEEETFLYNRQCNTPKYQERVRKCETEHPNIITLLLSLNTDGFRKRGCSRGEIWPVFLACHDVTAGNGSFREYNPHLMVLSAIMQTNTKLKSSDFSSLFERLRLEIEHSTEDPLRICLDGNIHDVRLELFQSVLDMDASRKIHGLPVWQSYRSCGYCTVEGSRLETRTGKKICWFPDAPVTEYSINNVPTKLLESCLPPPYLNGFDGLHLINEGTSRDILKHLLTTGRRIGVKIKKDKRERWSEALNSSKTPRGQTSSGLLDPIQLSTRTGTEVQQLYDLAIPTLLCLYSENSDWIQMVFIHWLFTRKVMDVHLSIEECDQIEKLSTLLSAIVGVQFPSLYTLKFHYLVDHMSKALRFNGSPLLSSAAPFERLNQTLGRSAQAYTTRTLSNISNRFMSLKRATFSCLQASKLTEDTNLLPATMDAFSKDLKSSNSRLEIDIIPLDMDERDYLKKYTEEDLSFRWSWNNGRKTFSIRKINEDRLVHNCYIYYISKTGRMGKKKAVIDKLLDATRSSERTRKRTTATTQDMQSIEPIKKSLKELNKQKPFSSSGRIFQNPEEAEEVYPSFKPYPNTARGYVKEEDDENLLSYERNSDENEEDGEEKEDEETQVIFTTPKRDAFSISRHLGGIDSETDPTDLLKGAIEKGSALEIGQVLREAFQKKTITELQVEEICQALPKPTISLLQFFNSYETATSEDRAAIALGQMLLTKMALLESNTVHRLQASINSLSSAFVSQTKVSMLEKRTLLRSHSIAKSGIFPRIDLVDLYDKTNLVGDTAYSQMTHFLTRTFRNALSPKFAIWNFTYRPRCIRPTDKHFSLFPNNVAENLIDFSYDLIGIYLPSDLLHGPLDPTHPFLDELSTKFEEPQKEIERRRNEREPVSQTMQSAIGQMLNYLRDYHYDVNTHELESCKNRKNCVNHLTWKDVKVYKERQRSQNLDPDDFDPKSLIKFAVHNAQLDRDKSPGTSLQRR